MLILALLEFSVGALLYLAGSAGAALNALMMGAILMFMGTVADLSESALKRMRREDEADIRRLENGDARR